MKRAYRCAMLTKGRGLIDQLSAVNKMLWMIKNGNEDQTAKCPGFYTILAMRRRDGTVCSLKAGFVF